MVASSTSSAAQLAVSRVVPAAVAHCTAVLRARPTYPPSRLPAPRAGAQANPNSNQVVKLLCGVRADPTPTYGGQNALGWANERADDASAQLRDSNPNPNPNPNPDPNPMPSPSPDPNPNPNPNPNQARSC